MIWNVHIKYEGRKRLREVARHSWALSRTALCVFVLLTALVGAGCQGSGGRPNASVRTGFALGTLVQVRAYAQGEQADEAVREAFARIEEVEALMSANVPSSDVAAVNRKAGGLPT